MTIHETAEAIVLAVSPHVPNPEQPLERADCVQCSAERKPYTARWPCVPFDDDLDHVTKMLTEFADKPERLKARLRASWGNLSPNTTFGSVLRIIEEAL